MKVATSKVSSQGQISVPAEVRDRLGIGPGSTVVWEAEDDVIVVRRGGRYSSTDIHEALFGGARPKRRSVREMDEAIAAHLTEKHARR